MNDGYPTLRRISATEYVSEEHPTIELAQAVVSAFACPRV